MLQHFWALNKVHGLPVFMVVLVCVMDSYHHPAIRIFHCIGKSVSRLYTTTDGVCVSGHSRFAFMGMTDLRKLCDKNI